MGKQKGRSKKGKTKGSSVGSFEQNHAMILKNCENVVSTSAPGCHCWNGISNSDWMLGKPERFRRSDFNLSKSDHVPDLSVDPSDFILTVINSSNKAKCYHITVEHSVNGRNGKPLMIGSARSEDNSQIKCVAFVLLLPPETMVEVCEIDKNTLENKTIENLKISSDIVDWIAHPSPSNHGITFDWFPLGGKGPFLCSQGCGGGLTHFSHPSTFHALDFETCVGTPVLAVGNGIVVDIRQKCCVSGIHVSHLFQWNAITLQLDVGNDDDGRGGAEENNSTSIIVEYVHIKAHSVRVAVGDRVEAGQVLCLSGDAGFCPVPHLHIEAHLSREVGAPSIPMSWHRRDGGFLSPVAGEWCAPNMCRYPITAPTDPTPTTTPPTDPPPIDSNTTTTSPELLSDSLQPDSPHNT